MSLSISEIRIRNPGEVIPISAEISNISWHGWTADKAIDLDFDTFSVAIAGSDGQTWTKLKLEKLYCVKQVITYIMDGQSWFIANCSQNSCTSNRDNQQAVISSSTEDTTLPLKTGCIFGDTVQVNTQEAGKLYEIAVMVLDLYMAEWGAWSDYSQSCAAQPDKDEQCAKKRNRTCLNYNECEGDNTELLFCHPEDCKTSWVRHTLTIVIGGGVALVTVIAVCVVTTVLIRKMVPQVRGKHFELAWFFLTL